MKETAHPTTLWENKGKTWRFTWYEGSEIRNFEPFNQVYGLIFNENGEVLIQKVGKSDWCLPGGTVEKGESDIDTLRRELIEEVDATIKNPILLGGQKVETIDSESGAPSSDDFYFQLRHYCELDELLPQTPDPDNNVFHDRKFVPAEEVNDYLKWGVTGDAIVSLAIVQYKNRNN